MDVAKVIENINATVSTKCNPDQPRYGADHAQMSRLCLACIRIFDVSCDTNTEFQQHRNHQLSEEKTYQSLSAVGEAAKHGCHLCTTLFMSLDPAGLRAFQRYATHNHTQIGHDSFRTGIGVGYVTITPVAHDQARLYFRWSLASQVSSHNAVESLDSVEQRNYNGNKSESTLADQSNRPLGRMEPELSMELIMMNPTYAVEPGVRTLSSAAIHTGSDECFEIARQWLQDCSFNHMKCSANEGASPIPKPRRLLDVTIKGPKGAPGLKLVDGDLLDPFTEYVTLSHCWGFSRNSTTKCTRLHTKTLSALRQGVACSSLPKTFADAAYATSKLGYKYLWIDALCVMHDYEQDVLAEVANMHRIYGEATLNLVATAAKDDSDGLFRKRNVRSLQPVTVYVHGELGIDCGLYKILRSTVWEDLIDKSPAARRSWIFQERALGKRMLHFSRSELIWECQQMCCSEVYPKALPVTLDIAKEQDKQSNGFSLSQAFQHANDSLHPRPKSVFDKRTQYQNTNNWPDLVEMYTDGRQSYTSDKLLGIAGLARQYANKNRQPLDDYVVGLWRSSLPHSLLWRIHEGGTRPSEYRAPSWTWAAVDGRAVSPASSAVSKHACLEIIEITTQMKNSDPMGICEDACLKVRGFMARGTVRRNCDYRGYCSFVLSPSNRAARSVRFEHAWFDEDLARVADEGFLSEVYLVPVIDVIDRVEGLILAATATRGDFTRLGVFEINNGDANHSIASLASRASTQEDWNNFKMLMKGDSGMSNFEERSIHANPYWFASNYTYTINIR